jgi:hypothetical protein
MSKYSNINYPLYGLSSIITLDFSLNKIYTTIKGQTFIVDDRSIPSESYFTRLLHLELEEQEFPRIKFDYTIRTLEELVKSNCKSAFDDSARLYNFYEKEAFTYSEREIVREHNGYIWFSRISYPFRLDVENIGEIIKNKQNYFGKLAYIDYCWYLLGLSDEKSTKDKILL